ncbi:MAG: hypothetical protein KF736_07765 [Acidobacteria bacterium]|nr:hypothetical protein [Acidobacteriota bacterium]MCW5948983.1 hypothetical protein [Pyrinomonadaceae bacterium]
MATNKKRFGRRTVVFFWIAVVALITGVLIATEQIAALYVLATLALVALLLIVGFADLENVKLQAPAESEE